MNFYTKCLNLLIVLVLLQACAVKPVPPPEPVDLPLLWQLQACDASLQKVTPASKIITIESLNRLIDFQNNYCKKAGDKPNLLLASLTSLRQQLDWPSAYQNYFSILQWHLQRLNEAHRKTQLLQNKIKHTLSDLAKLEQQLLQRDLSNQDGQDPLSSETVKAIKSLKSDKKNENKKKQDGKSLDQLEESPVGK